MPAKFTASLTSLHQLNIRCMQVGPKEFVKAILRHRSDKNPVQRCLDTAANEVLAFRNDAYDTSEWSTEDKGELLNMALGAVHMQCIDAGVCYAQTGHQVTLDFVMLPCDVMWCSSGLHLLMDTCCLVASAVWLMVMQHL